MNTIDYNGPGPWTAQEIIRRYQKYAKRFGLAQVRTLTPRVYTDGDRRWVSPVMEPVIEGIKAGDLACAQIGVEFLEEDQGFAFGMILKDNTARALRRFEGLTSEQVHRIRARVVGMLLQGPVPREYRQYAKLLRKVGFGGRRGEILEAQPKNRHAAWAQAYFRDHCDGDEAG